MIKTTISEILNSQESLEKILAKELPAVSSFRLAKITEKINDELKVFNTVRQKLYEKYGDISEENPTEIKLKEEHIDSFTEEIDKVLKEEVSLDVNKLKIEDLDSVEITPLEIYPVMWLMEE